MALKSKRFIFYLDHGKLSLGIFFIMNCLMEGLLHQLSGYTFIFFFKNLHQKAANLLLRLILAVAMVYVESFEVRFKEFLSQLLLFWSTESYAMVQCFNHYIYI